VTVAVRTPAARIEALDISGAALEVAQKNAVRHGVSERIEFRQSDLFGAVAPERRFDLVVSNPPYIPTSEIEHLQPEVRDHDPRCALDGGADGLEIYRRLAAETPERLNPEGVLMAEFGDGQETQVTRCFEERHWTIQDLVSDLAGKPRIVIARKPLP
jgi:release factor glutamine methyltransferase